MITNETQLTQQVIAGDASAFEQLYTMEQIPDTTSANESAESKTKKGIPQLPTSPHQSQLSLGIGNGSIRKENAVSVTFNLQYLFFFHPSWASASEWASTCYK